MAHKHKYASRTSQMCDCMVITGHEISGVSLNFKRSITDIENQAISGIFVGHLKMYLPFIKKCLIIVGINDGFGEFITIFAAFHMFCCGNLHK